MPTTNNHIEETQIRSDEVQEILTKPPIWIVRWGITLLFLFVVIFTALSFIIKYPDFVSAKLIVTTAIPAQHIVAKNSGKLNKIFVKDRDTVSNNQALAVVDNQASFEDVFFLKRITDSLQITEEQFEFPINLTKRLNLGDVNNAYFDFEKSYLDYYLLKDLNPYSDRVISGSQSVTEMKTRLYDQIKQQKIAQEEYKLASTELERHKTLLEKGVISQQEYETKQREFLQIQKNLSAMTIAISQMREAVLTAGQTLKETKISQIEDGTRFQKNLLLSYNALKKAIRDWEYNYVLKSSLNGVVSFQEVWGSNQFVNANDIVYTILPTDKSELVGRLMLPAMNSGKVTSGQKVLVKLDNYPYQQYGMLVGKVKNMSISPNSDGDYVVYISLPNGTKTSYGQELPFDQELLGNAEIITEDLSIADRLLYQFKDIFKY